jgi:hypothetical protein
VCVCVQGFYEVDGEHSIVPQQVLNLLALLVQKHKH